MNSRSLFLSVVATLGSSACGGPESEPADTSQGIRDAYDALLASREIAADVKSLRIRSLWSVELETASIDDLRKLSMLPATTYALDAASKSFDAQPAGWWPLDFTKLRTLTPTAWPVATVLEVDGVLGSRPFHYDAIALVYDDATVRLVDPVLDPSVLGSVGENFGAEKPPPWSGPEDSGTITVVNDGDGCPNMNWLYRQHTIRGRNNDSWGLFNRTVMEFAFEMTHEASVDCRKASDNTCYAAALTKNVRNLKDWSRSCAAYAGSDTCGSDDWAEGLRTFTSGNSLVTYSDTGYWADNTPKNLGAGEEGAPNTTHDDIMKDQVNGGRAGYHVKSLAVGRVMTTRSDLAAPALPAWALYLYYTVSGAAATLHIIKGLHWLAREDRNDAGSGWYEYGRTPQWMPDAEILCNPLPVPDVMMPN